MRGKSDSPLVKVINPEIFRNLYEQQDSLAYKPVTDISQLCDTFWEESCMETFTRIPDNSLDAIITDEPHGVKGNVLFFEGQVPKNTIFAWDDEWPLHLKIPWVYEAARTLKPGGALINLGTTSWCTTFEAVCNDAGLSFRCHDLWYRTNPAPRIRHGGFRSGHIVIWVATKGTARNEMKRVAQAELLNWTISTVCPNCSISFPIKYSIQISTRDHGWWEPFVHVAPKKAPGERWHETEQPDWLPAFYTHLFTEEGDVIYDPFAGSGTFSRMAHLLKRRYICSETDPDNAKKVRSMLSSLPQHMM
jgi:site-specific DNA-methyltransferase (adenine-specific)